MDSIKQKRKGIIFILFFSIKLGERRIGDAAKDTIQSLIFNFLHYLEASFIHFLIFLPIIIEKTCSVVGTLSRTH